MDGIGKEEVVKAVAGLMTGFLIAIIVHFIKGFRVEFYIFAPAICCFGTLMLVKKNTRNVSTIDLIKQMVAYHNSQKIFFYKYVNIYEKDRKEEEKKSEKGSE